MNSGIYFIFYLKLSRGYLSQVYRMQAVPFLELLLRNFIYYSILVTILNGEYLFQKYIYHFNFLLGG